MHKHLKVILQIAFICFFYKLISFIVNLLGIPFPPNVLGMMIMAVLLITGIIPMRWVEEGAGFLLKYMPLWFVPIGVAMMNYWGLLKTHLLVLIPVLIISSLVVAAATGYSSVIWQKWLGKSKSSGDADAA